MNQELKQELDRVIKQVNHLIADDAYPEAIEPEILRCAVRAYPMRGGKRLRPVLTEWACGALGGNPDLARFAAASIEIYHNWTLVHDDIIDCDDFRRGLPTTHVELKRGALAAFESPEPDAEKFGRDFAILAGDIQQGWARHMMLRSADNGVPAALVLQLLKRYEEDVTRGLISGEALDVEFPLRELQSISRGEVMAMISGKTAVLLKFACCCGGAIAAGNTDFNAAPLSHLRDFAENLGVAFQLRDDYLGVFGEVTRFGKPICSDFHESKPTILYLEAMSRLRDDDADELRALTGLDVYDAAKIERIRQLLTKCGAADAVQAQTAQLTAQARESLANLPDNRYRTLLSDLLTELLERTI